MDKRPERARRNWAAALIAGLVLAVMAAAGAALILGVVRLVLRLAGGG
ncbi:hypothetical protein [Brevirhabdus sp.]